MSTVSITATVDGSLYHQNISTFTNVVPILGFTFSANASRNSATGESSSSNSLYTPVTFYKEMNISSPLLMKILTTNEVLQATIAMAFQKMEFDATAGGKTVVTNINGQTPIV
jgi:type VI protein secretion system component Hcp